MKACAISSQIVDLRIRNRLIEYLEMLVSYQNDPPAFDLNEVLNQWEDWVESPVTLRQFQPPAFSTGEARLLVQVGHAWERLCNYTPRTIRDESAVLGSPEWILFVSTAQRALAELLDRGKLVEG